ncbi:MAG: hypothetical protein VCB43_08090 [Myxococcota bacterium]
MRTAPTPTTVTKIGIAFGKRSIISGSHSAGFEVTSKTPMQNLAMAVIDMIKLCFMEI